jgi:ABC-type transport system involved in multi-copper enzyme maturation permease subunit
MDVIRADRFYLALLVVVPVVMGFLSYATGSSYGFDQGFMTKAGFRFNPTARTTVMVLVLGTIFIALAASIQEIIKEREIVNREKNAGVRPIAYVASKFFVLSILVSMQTTVFALIVLFKRPMTKIETFSGSPLLSIFIFCLLLGLVTLLLGLLVSASISSSEQAMPTLVGIIMVQIILSGLLPIDFKGVIEKMSPFIPSYVATNGLAGATNLAQTTFVQDEKLLLRWGTSFENSYSSLSQLGFFLVLFFALTTFVMQKRD